MKPRVLLVESHELGMELKVNGGVDLTVEHSVALGMNRLGWQDFDFVVLDEEAAGAPARQIFVDFLVQNHLPFMLLVSHWHVCNGMPSLERTAHERFVPKILQLLAGYRPHQESVVVESYHAVPADTHAYSP
jgi:hypothetical protein